MNINRYIIVIASLVSMSGIHQMVSADVNQLVENCFGCHGKDGVSTYSEIPTIAGYSAYYITESMAIYKDKERPCAETEYQEGKDKGSKSDMCKIAKNLSEAEIEAIAEFFANKPFVRAKQTFDAGKASKGKNIHKTSCSKCHEDGGSSADDDAGILAGQWMPYLQETFREYAAETRAQPKKMKVKMEKLDDAEVESLIHYYASFQ